ncbi:hypothetical protein HPB49_004427 [Dermacentor silvarum]|uniref:Uncharacterized protein n=1 Tax=Dermacentor silvarum TaxID=543639 RepID=A0ACB8DUP7_DERSI|nr:hypothetical protein HPB49_004427 [Dermacentor silvarum]
MGKRGRGENQTKRDFRRRKRRGPSPLPKEDIKVILRPHKGLIFKNLLGSELSVAVIEAYRKIFGGDSFLLRVHPGSNAVILSKPHEQVAGRLREISQLKIRGQIHLFNEYVPDPEDVLSGIVDGLPPGTIEAELMANLRIRTQGGNIERASNNNFYRQRTTEPTIQACKICRSTGHRTDVCPTPNANVCSKCGASNPNQGHECAPNCAICANRPEETPGKRNMKKISSSSGEKSSPQAGKAEEEAAAAGRTTNQWRWWSSFLVAINVTSGPRIPGCIDEEDAFSSSVLLEDCYRPSFTSLHVMRRVHVFRPRQINSELNR